MPIRPLIASAALIALTLCAACSPPSEKPSENAPEDGTTESAPAQATSTPATTPAPSAGAESVATPVIARVLAAPIPVPGTDGKTHLAYELALTNTMPHDVTLTSVGVRAGDRTLLDLPGDRLAYWTRLAGNHDPTTTIGPAQTAFVWLDVALDADEPVPTELTHAVGVKVSEPMPPLIPEDLTEDVAPVTVQTRAPVVIAPPLAGPNWLDANGCCDMTPHRMALNPINGELWAAERFAVDYIQLGPDGRLFTGDLGKLDSFPYFGTDILAVGDGPVVRSVDGRPEQVPGATPTGLALDEYGGNYIVQDLGDGNYAFYAHLQTGSVKVKPGDQLTTGQAIASLGNSGNTTAPHLHFHVMSTPDPLRSNGLPFVLRSFRLDSRITDGLDPLFDGKPAALEPGFAPRDETDTAPLVDDVMTYADR
ncbi:peptidoglycan DD-metalloendopeptidase family protein [Mycobacterium sp. Y57]|uniref:M23 family metallopeptidase n=1 Tax=Mycolicibacterium xanthum TaxID=2796469 RepID=UPI001C865409|nr:M23 family metallopeptidase [Mycolicibacterium xanthum]MBX7431714.1 peptidoglycan DD-metalloendopeptidase family protein [Mycolicibacterium xanthum]